MKYAFIEAEKAGPISVERLCEALEVGSSSFYAWRGNKAKPPTKREQENRRLTELITAIHVRSRGTYGCPRILAALRREGVRVGVNRIRRIMAQNGIYGRRPPRRGQPHKVQAGAASPNLLERNFVTPKPNQVWCGDITEFRIAQRRFYVATVIDVFARRVVGLAFGLDATSELTVRAMVDAIRRRKPPPGLLFHSDRGSQYRAASFRRVLRRWRIVQSMSRSGNCLDNAVAESFFATLEHELASRSTWVSVDQAEEDIRDFVLGFYNQHRLHSSLGYMSPNDYEAASAA